MGKNGVFLVTFEDCLFFLQKKKSSENRAPSRFRAIVEKYVYKKSRHPIAIQNGYFIFEAS
ncbi:MAG: hypothetical protein IJU33_04925 [Bacteroidales bacterium]|nr:hypothetical protein [Bacteroidales bacterium]